METLIPINASQARNDFFQLLNETYLQDRGFLVIKGGIPMAQITKTSLKPRIKVKKKNAGLWLLSLAKEAERLGVRGPKDLASNLDKYLYGGK